MDLKFKSLLIYYKRYFGVQHKWLRFIKLAYKFISCRHLSFDAM